MTKEDGVGKWGYPPVPAPGGDLVLVPDHAAQPSAPPLPPAEAHKYDLKPGPKDAALAAPGGGAVAAAPAPERRGGWSWGPWAKRQSAEERAAEAAAKVFQEAAGKKGVAVVAAPKLEPQPWVRRGRRGRGGGGAGGPRAVGRGAASGTGAASPARERRPGWSLPSPFAPPFHRRSSRCGAASPPAPSASRASTCGGRRERAGLGRGCGSGRAFARRPCRPLRTLLEPPPHPAPSRPPTLPNPAASPGPRTATRTSCRPPGHPPLPHPRPPSPTPPPAPAASPGPRTTTRTTCCSAAAARPTAAAAARRRAPPRPRTRRSTLAPTGGSRAARGSRS
jgi:hypothetical protein